MQEPDRREIPLTLRVTRDEADRLRDLMWTTRQRLSGWLREVALREATKLERRYVPPDQRGRSGTGTSA